MPNSKWDEDHIENLLRDFPAIKDERPKEEVYKQLKKTHRTNGTKKKTNRWIPYLVAAMAFITLGVLLASMLGQQSEESALEMSGAESGQSNEESAERAADSSAVFDNAETGESAETESAPVTESEDNSEAATAIEEDSMPASESAEAQNIEAQNIFTLGLTENAFVVPVSFLISDETLQEDFGKTDVNAAELYNRYAAEVDEEALGFDEYHPYAGTITATGEGIEHILPANHNYDIASAAISVYLNSLAASFEDAEEISILDESGNAASFDQVGPLQPVDPAPANLAYYSYILPSGESYLVPAYDMPHETATGALEAMKSSPNDFYDSLIPEELEYTVSETAETVAIEFESEIDFDLIETEIAVRMIEGLILSADSFGKTLVLNNAASDSWNGFDFTEPLPVPVTINSRNLK